MIEELTTTNTEENLKYYKYLEEDEEKGRLYEFRYRCSANLLEMYCRNTFKSYTPEGSTYARGNAIVYPQHFLRDFGVSMKVMKKWLPAFYNILICKYDLKVFTEVITEAEE